jgi:hypothetical protein
MLGAAVGGIGGAVGGASIAPEGRGFEGVYLASQFPHLSPEMVAALIAGSGM